MWYPTHFAEPCGEKEQSIKKNLENFILKIEIKPFKRSLSQEKKSHSTDAAGFSTAVTIFYSHSSLCSRWMAQPFPQGRKCRAGTRHPLTRAPWLQAAFRTVPHHCPPAPCPCRQKKPLKQRHHLAGVQARSKATGWDGILHCCFGQWLPKQILCFLLEHSSGEGGCCKLGLAPCQPHQL